jgi:very-short-patch-repair endonuclease
MLCKRRGIVSLREQRFSYPDTSLFDLFSQTNGVVPVLLRDHYRCAPEIAEYANRIFYGSRLRVVTAADRLRVPRGFHPGIYWTEVESDFQTRRTGCVASAEVGECQRLLRRLLLEDAFLGTVGIVTPFREQKQLLEQAVFSDPALAEAAMRAQVVIDTAHGFQGAERDVMIMSLCAGPGMPATSLGWLRKTGNLLNVAATRARALLHIIGHRRWAAQCGIPHITGLARPAPDPHAGDGPVGARFESPWERRLYEALIEQGLKPIPQYPLLGRRLDLALVGPEKPSIDIEVDGARFHLEPDGSRKRDDIWRDISIRGAGWRVMRFWVYELRDNMPKCVDGILGEWGKT